MPDTPRRTDRAERLIAATRRELYAARLDRGALVRWLAPPGTSLSIETFEPVTGGAFRLVMTFATAPGKTTAHTDVIEGRFVLLEEPRRVVTDVDFVTDNPAFAGTMRMSWTFTRAEGGTLAEIVAENVPPGIDEASHIRSLAASLKSLAHYVET